MKIYFVLAAAALLWPCVASGANPSADLSVNVVTPVSTPAAASVAGFNTLAGNYDFTQPLPAGWLGCAPFDSNAHQWYQGQWWYANEPPCDITQGTDPLTNAMTLVMNWQPSYASAGTGGQYMSTLSHDNNKVTDYPNAYYEITYRITPTLDKSYTALWTWTQRAAQGVGAGPIEWDFIETYGQWLAGYGATIHTWAHNADTNGVWSNSLPSGYDPTQYHTYAGRITSDGSTQISFCSYLDGNLMKCQNVGNPISSDFTNRNALIVGNGTCCGNVNTTGQTTMYIKSIRVWSCAKWQTEMCNGTALTAAP
jgi:hypothetical protein